MVSSLIPCRLKLGGINRSMLSGWALRAPSAASLSASSFPLFPVCPLTHVKVVGAERFLSWYAVVCRRDLLLIFVQPWSSHSPRWMVRPFITYFESVIILMGVRGSAD